MGKAAGIALLVLGLVIGPGTYLGSRFFSGRVLVEAPLTFAIDSEGRPQARFAFSLPADALPAAVVVQVSASHGPVVTPADLPVDDWTLRVLKDDRPIHEQTMRLRSHTVEATPALVFKESIALDATQGSGNYVLEVVPPAAPRMPPDAVRVEVRAGVTPADPTWLVAGLVILAAGLVLLLSA